MILYSDAHTKNLESAGQWTACVEYLYCMWKTNRGNAHLFLKLSVDTWYTLTLDGPELTLRKAEFDLLEQILTEAYHYFITSFSTETDCQWLFGYMMTTRTDLFLASGLEYSVIEQQGDDLIAKARSNGSVLAQLLYALGKSSGRDIRKSRETVKKHIDEYFDVTQAVDKYLIEMLMVDA